MLKVSLWTPNTNLVLLNILPRLLRMQMRPWMPYEDCDVSDGTSNGHGHSTNGGRNIFLVLCRRRSSLGLITKAEEYTMNTARSELVFSRLRERDGLMKYALEKIRGYIPGIGGQPGLGFTGGAPENKEWFLVGRVIDRVCFITMALSFLMGTIGIFLTGHFNQPPSVSFPSDTSKCLPPLGNNITNPPGNDTGANLLG
ncbi:unnamed protein product [Coregonus sp. 'balchen']|nr:unnamed protein product [Coregonus sp. 'balchen']